MSDYTEKQRDAAQKWALANAELIRLDENVRDATTQRDKQRRHVDALEETLKEFVGSNQPRKLYRVDEGIVIVQRHEGRHGPFVCVDLDDFV